MVRAVQREAPQEADDGSMWTSARFPARTPTRAVPGPLWGAQPEPRVAREHVLAVDPLREWLVQCPPCVLPELMWWTWPASPRKRPFLRLTEASGEHSLPGSGFPAVRLQARRPHGRPQEGTAETGGRWHFSPRNQNIHEGRAGVSLPAGERTGRSLPCLRGWRPRVRRQDADWAWLFLSGEQEGLPAERSGDCPLTLAPWNHASGRALTRMWPVPS